MNPTANTPRALDAAPKYTLLSGIGLLVVSVWLLVFCRDGRPGSWLGELAYCFGLIVSLIGAPSLFLLSAIDLFRGKRGPVGLAVLTCSFISLLLIATFLWWRVRLSFHFSQ